MDTLQQTAVAVSVLVFLGYLQLRLYRIYLRSIKAFILSIPLTIIINTTAASLAAWYLHGGHIALTLSLLMLASVGFPTAWYIDRIIIMMDNRELRDSLKTLRARLESNG